jgi:glycosyltransferase involved in cell wall biosynthesis
MKVLFIIDCLASGGKERRLTELMKMLRTKSTTLFELVVMSSDIHYKEVLELNIKIHYVLRKSKKDISVFGKLYAICRNYKPDIVHCWDDMTAVYIAPICKILKIKMVNGMVVDTPVNFSVRNKSWLRAKLTFPLSDLIIGNSHAGLKAYNAPVHKSICIYNGMHLSRFDNLKNQDIVLNEIFGGKSQHDFIVGMVAAFEDRKDYETLIKAAIVLVSIYDDIKFVFVGDGKNLKSIKSCIPTKVEGKFLFLGKRSEIELIVNSFDLGVLLTNTKVHGEGISNSILEYMAMSKPVIATKGGGTNELVVNNVNGYLIDAENVEQLIEKIQILKNNPLMRIEFGKNGRKLIGDKFEINVMTQKYLDQYNLLLNKN